MKEMISEPNYSPADLARVNVPDKQAQYIANHVPNAELWVPEKTGHHGHQEREQERVGFLKKKG